MATTHPKTGKPIEPLLGLEQVTRAWHALGWIGQTHWQILCWAAHPGAQPRVILAHENRALCERFLTSPIIAQWSCPACQQPYHAHVRLWTEDVPLAEAFRAHRAMQLSEQATQAPARPTPVAPEELEARGTEPTTEARVNAKLRDTAKALQERAQPQPEPTPTRRGPQADRLDKARQAQTDALRPKPRKPAAQPKDPFEEEDV